MTAAPPRPSVVFLLCDDLGYGDLGCFGHPVIRTPHLDRLASEGLKLTHCYSPAPVCSPARAGFLTGRTPLREGIADWIPQDSGIHLRKGAVTVAALLKRAGYATCVSGKWHLSSRMDGSEPLPGDHGFDHWFATQNNAAPSHRNPTNFYRNGRAVGPLEGYSSTVIVDEAVRWLEGVPADRPFFLYVPFHTPHEPVATAEEFVAMYPAAQPAERAQYYGNVTQMDHEVGRLLGALERLGRRQDTLVLFTSDNGPETLNRYRGAARSYGSPGDLRGMKLWLYEGGIREPGILRWPARVRPGQVSTEPVSGVDLLPTLCELAGAAPPADRPVDGASFVPLLDGRPIPRRAPLYWQYPRALGAPKVALRDGPWKVLAEEGPSRFELYNLQDDPKEERNLAEAEPARLKALAARLAEFYHDVRRETA